MDLEENEYSLDLTSSDFKSIFPQINQIFENKDNYLESYEDTKNWDLRYFKSFPIFPENDSNNSFHIQPINQQPYYEKTNKFIIKKNSQINLIKNEEGKNKTILGKKKAKEKVKKSHDKHDKFCIDNMIRKIKTNIMEYILTKLNDSLNDKEFKFHRIDKQLTECIKKDYNINLLNRTVFDIYYNSKISKKYKSKIDDYYNRYLINKILEEQKEINTINLLNKKFIDILNEIRKKKENRNIFFNKIKKKENKLKEARMEEYLLSLRKLLLGYEKWFNDKKGRNRTANKNSKKTKLFIMKSN